MSKVEISALSEGYIKSCARTDVESLRITEKGPYLGRHWMVVDENGRFMLSDIYPKMVWVEPVISKTDNVLILKGRNFGRQVEVPIRDRGLTRIVEMFGGLKYEALDDGEKAANWLGEFLNVDGCRLVHMPQSYVRTDGSGLARFEFADSWSISLGNDASLDDLNGKIKEKGRNPVPRERFGHDVWVTGANPFDEDTWGEIIVGGGQEVIVVKPIVRCSRTLVRREAETLKELLKKDIEPLATLNQVRRVVEIRDGRRKNEVIFGQKLAHVWDGKEHEIHVGDKVEVSIYKSPPELATK